MVDSNASKNLKKIRRLIEECEAKIKERLEKFLKNSENKKYIQDCRRIIIYRKNNC